jgi:hypothetical protein
MSNVDKVLELKLNWDVIIDRYIKHNSKLPNAQHAELVSFTVGWEEAIKAAVQAMEWEAE